MARKMGWAAVCVWLGTAISVAQAPVVPTDHYGPPQCSPVAADAKPKPAKPRMTEAAGLAIEAAGAADASVVASAPPMENFDLQRHRLADYADCVGSGGCYWADVDAQFKRAEAVLEREVAGRKHGEKLAMVLDIDETSLSGYCEMQAEDYGYIPAMSDAWIVSPKAAVAIPGALRLFKQAKAAGVEVFFITGRPEAQREGTVANLEAAGYHGWKDLNLKAPAEHELSTTEYKSGRRKRIAAEYRIVLSVGDQWSDLNGEPKAAISVKLPNPFYFLP